MAFQSAARNADIAEMNITPLVDVMLVLLIIFMVATPLMSRTLSLDLPIPSDAPPPPPPDVITLHVDASGALHWNGRALPGAALDAMMRVEASRDQAPILQLDIADGADYAHLASLLGRARAAGLERIALPWRSSTPAPAARTRPGSSACSRTRLAPRASRDRVGARDPAAEGLDPPGPATRPSPADRRAPVARPLIRRSDRGANATSE